MGVADAGLPVIRLGSVAVWADHHARPDVRACHPPYDRLPACPREVRQHDSDRRLGGTPIRRTIIAMRFLPHRPLLPALLLLAATASASLAQEHPLRVAPQPGRFTPLNQHEVPGKVGRWNVIAKPSLYGYFQPLRIELPSEGLVSFYTPEQPQPVLTHAPAQAAMLIGPVYRLKIAGLPEYPGVELYPTIEVTDRLHPPAGQENEWPIPVDITTEEIEAVLQDRMVTKVIYLENPQRASLLNPDDDGIITFDAQGRDNLLDAADQLGRPVAILRIGGRTPDPNNPLDILDGPPAPIRVAASVTP